MTVHSRQQPVVIHVAPVGVRFQQPSERPSVLPHRKLHMIFGIIQMLVGVLCFILDLVAVCLITTYPRLGTGIYCGIFFFIPGLLGFLAGTLNSTCCIVGCMVMNIIGLCVATVGMSFASIGISWHMFYYNLAYSSFVYDSTAFVLAACVFEFILTIIHASFTCASCCYCCMSRAAVADSNEMTATGIHQRIQFVEQQTPQPVFYQYPQQSQPLQFYPGQIYYPSHQPMMQWNFPSNYQNSFLQPEFQSSDFSY